MIFVKLQLKKNLVDFDAMIISYKNVIYDNDALMISDNCFVHIIYFHGNDVNFVANNVCILMKIHLNMFI